MKRKINRQCLLDIAIYIYTILKLRRSTFLTLNFNWKLSLQFLYINWRKHRSVTIDVRVNNKYDTHVDKVSHLISNTKLMFAFTHKNSI